MKNSNWDVLINRLQKDDLISRDVSQLTEDQLPWVADALIAGFDRAVTLGLIEFFNHVMDNTDDTDAYTTLATERDKLLRKKQDMGW